MLVKDSPKVPRTLTMRPETGERSCMLDVIPAPLTRTKVGGSVTVP